MQQRARAVACPVCDGEAFLAITTPSVQGSASVDPNDVGLVCTNGCRPTTEQVRPLLTALEADD
jgi:hypothetical protein